MLFRRSTQKFSFVLSRQFTMPSIASTPLIAEAVARVNFQEPVPSDSDISSSVEPFHISKIAADNGILEEELSLYGKYQAKISLSIRDRLKDNTPGSLVLVTSINPTPLGEDTKSTTTAGLAQSLAAHLGKKTFANVRQGSTGVAMGVKGSSAGGGYAQVIPLPEFALHGSGDIHAIGAANNLLAAALETRMFHEKNNIDDDFKILDRLCPAHPKTGVRVFAPIMERRLEKLGITERDPSKLTPEEIKRFVRLDVDPATITWNRVLDVSDRFLRRITVGQGPNEVGHERQTGFDLTVASELMAILALTTDLKDMRERIGRITVGQSYSGEPVTADDLGVAGAVTALMRDTIQPTLMQTIEGTPVLVHAGPFANIAHGNSSIIADQIALKLVEEDGYVVTEAGFGADIGAEKFFNIKCRASGVAPRCVVIVVTVRAIKCHGGGPLVEPGKPLDKAYLEENLDLVKQGVCNMQHHVRCVRKYNVSPVVCINRFSSDTDAEIELIKQAAIEAGAEFAVESNHWGKGGAGAVELSEAVIKVCEKARADEKAGVGKQFKFLYPLEDSIVQKIETICKETYGAEKVEFSEEAAKKIERYTKAGYGNLPICMAKTHLSLSTDAKKKGVPTGFSILVRDVRASVGAGFIYPLLGDIMTIPGLPIRPAYFDIDVDDKGDIIGLF